ncbi:hypothetical protein PFLCHA0_c25370 [Pseudomonas protegens CHA0]|uniref:Uncharacterized protein n=1 Tax=Pseudomonas protegens (strain DSM 19095 / LMG 27888 / CFBP 6595 / CHA0) TaxID=1124983 RepID=A0A2C9EL77_PSEPH|nr:hypothetical protein PFLCHA0_c25370 [Pseudomonas protegens CHA0]
MPRTARLQGQKSVLGRYAQGRAIRPQASDPEDVRSGADGSGTRPWAG